MMRCFHILFIPFLLLYHSFYVYGQSDKQLPDIRMTGLNNDTLSLSELQGNIVLIEFWASWNKYSRDNHYKLNNIYNRYHNSNFINAKSFEIYSISLDVKMKDWESACQQDGLSWNYNVCDFQSWHTQAVYDYNIISIPTYILINSNGEIIRTLKKIDELEGILQSLMK